MAASANSVYAQMGFLHDVLFTDILFDLCDINLYLYNQCFLYSPNLTLQTFSAAVIPQCLHHTKLHVTHTQSQSHLFCFHVTLHCIFLHITVNIALNISVWNQNIILWWDNKKL